MRLSKLGLFKVIVTELYNLSQFHCLLYIGAKIKDFRAVAETNVTTCQFNTRRSG